MTAASSLRLAARLSRREVLRRPWRTVLVALLVAVPVTGMTMAAAFVRTDNPGEAAEWRRDWGEADLVLFASASASDVGPAADGSGNDDTDDTDVLAALPAGSRVVSWRVLHTLVRTVEPRRRAHLEVLDVPMTDSIGSRVMQVLRGREAVAANEVFLTREAAQELGVDVGDELRIDKPAPLTLRVTGVGEQRAYWGSMAAVVGPGTPFPWTARADVPRDTRHAVDLPPGTTPSDVRRLVGPDQSLSIAPWLNPYPQPPPSGTSAVAWSWVIGAVVLTVVGIVIASAFAAGARRQLSTLGQLSANGATPAVLRQVLFLQGTWAGAVGTGVGLGLGGLGLRLLAPHADRMFGRDVEPWTVNPLDLVPVAVLGVLAATVAASVPARSTSRIPVPAALAGRRPLGRVPRWVTAAGATSGLGGLGLLGLAVLGSSSGSSDVWAITAILGGVAVLLGACAMAPGYSSLLEPLGSRLRGSWRLAARSLARQRTRTSAMVAAVCASGALAVAASGLVLGAHASDGADPEWMRPNEVHLTAQAVPPPGLPTAPHGGRFGAATSAPPPQEVVAAVQAVMPGAERMQLTAARPSSPDLQWMLEDFEPSSPTTQPTDESNVWYWGQSPSGDAVLFDAAAARAYGLRPEHREAFQRDGVLAFAAEEGRGVVAVRSIGPEDFARRNSPAVATVAVTVAAARPYALGALPTLLVSPEVAERLGFVTSAGIVVLRQPTPLTPGQRSAVTDVVDDARLEYLDSADDQPSLEFHALLFRPGQPLNPLLLEALLTGASLVFSLFVVAVGLALAAAETRDERDVLLVVGAPPSAMRATSGRKASLLAALGAVLAVPVGFLPVVVFVAAESDGMPLVFPWRVVALLLVAVPLVAGVVTTLGSGVALRLRPVRVSTMAFD